VLGTRTTLLTAPAALLCRCDCGAKNQGHSCGRA
jgi:hypothetical protein